MVNNQAVNYQITGQNLLSNVLRQIDNDAQRATNSVNGIGGSGSGMLGTFIKGNLISGAISRAGAEIKGFIGDIKDSLVNYEYFNTAVTTMLHGNENAAKALNSQLISLAKTTPFELRQVQDATKQLMAYGVTGGDVVSTLRTLGDVTAGLGADKLPFIIRAFGQIKSKGHLAGQELNQLTEQGFNPLKIISEKTGKSYGTLLKEMEKGQITFKQVEQTFKDVTAEGGQFFNLMEKQSQTVGGKLSAWSDIWEQIRVNIGRSQSGIISGTLDFANKMLGQLNNVYSNENQIEDSFKKYGVKSNSWWEGHQAANENDPFGDNKNVANTKYQDALNKNYVERASASRLAAAQSMASLQQLIANNTGTAPLMEQGRQQNAQNLAILKGTLDVVKGIYSNFKSKGVENSVKDDPKKDKLGTGVTIESHTPKNQYITINGGLVHQMTIESMDGNTPTTQIKEEVSSALVELLNDAYQAMR